MKKEVKDVAKMLINEPTKRLKERINTPSAYRKSGGPLRADALSNSAEDRMIEAIDMRGKISKFLDFEQKVMSGLIDPAQLFAGMAPEVALSLVKVALNGETERSRLDAMKDLLDRAGYSKVQKHAVASLDPNTSKEQLISMILGLNDKSKVVEVEDDESN